MWKNRKNFHVEFVSSFFLFFVCKLQTWVNLRWKWIRNRVSEMEVEWYQTLRGSIIHRSIFTRMSKVFRVHLKLIARSIKGDLIFSLSRTRLRHCGHLPRRYFTFTGYLKSAEWGVFSSSPSGAIGGWYTAVRVTTARVNTNRRGSDMKILVMAYRGINNTKIHDYDAHNPSYAIGREFIRFIFRRRVSR